MVLGSCFAAGIGKALTEKGLNVCINPFGTLFNPVSIRSSIDRLVTAREFTGQDCVQMGAGSSLWCSFSHYTRFARASQQEFLDNANKTLSEAAEFYRSANYLIITFGTAWCFRHKERDMIVSNCLKRPAAEFERFRLEVDEIAALYADDDVFKGKNVILTVSPIRHLADGAHANQISKSTLLLACDRILEARRRGEVTLQADIWGYFPSYEIMMDELRDYRWYADDGMHPGEAAAEIIFDRFEQDFKLDFFC